MPDGFVLYHNYPNPFNPSTTISFLPPQREHATLKIFDVLGKEVAMLVDWEFNAGKHTVNFNAKWIPSGVYTDESCESDSKNQDGVGEIKNYLVKKNYL